MAIRKYSKRGDSCAITYSLVETAKENGLNAFAYLKYLFEQLPNTDIENPDAIAALLPWSEQLPNRVRTPKHRS